MRSLIRFAPILLAGVSIVSACASAPIYEERYRIFVADGPITDLVATDSPQTIGEHFRPMAVLNLAFERLSGEGFHLARLEALPGGEGATLFTFRRVIPEGYRPTRAPMEFTGVYLERSGFEGDPAYYFFEPRLKGYTIHIFGPEAFETVRADWDGSKLRWQSGSEENSIVLSDDAREITRTIDTVVAGVTPRVHREIAAWRVDSLN